MKQPSFTALVLLVTGLALPRVSAQEEPTRPAAEPSLQSERRELAEIRLLVAADRKFPEARERLETLTAVLRPRSPSDREASELLAAAERLFAEVLRALGLAPAEAGAPGQDKVDEAVRKALANGDFQFIEQLGKRAAPGLAEAVRAAAEALPGEAARDPLVLLARFDPQAVDALAGEFLERGGFLWKRRLLRAVEEGGLVEKPEVWPEGERPRRRFQAPGILAALERYSADPEVSAEALQLVKVLSDEEALTPALLQAIEGSLRSDDPRSKEAAREAIRWGREQVRPLVERLLADPDVELRVFAASWLANWWDAEVLTGAVADADPYVRERVVHWLGHRGEKPQWGESEREALVRLLADAASGIREKAWELLAGFPSERRDRAVPPEETDGQNSITFQRQAYLDPLPDDVYRSLLDSTERERLVHIASLLPAALCFEILGELAAEPHTAGLVLDRIDDAPWWEDPASALRVVSVAFEEGAADPDRHRNVSFFLRTLQQTRSGLEALLRWALALEQDEWWRTTFVEQPAFDFAKLKRIDPELAAAFTARLFALDFSRVKEGMRRLEPAPAPLRQAFLTLAADPSRPLLLRLLALDTARTRDAHGGVHVDENFADVALALFRDPAWRALEDADPEWVAGEIREVTGGDNRIILALLEDPDLPLVWFGELVSSFHPGGPEAPEIARRILERWFDGGTYNAAVEQVIEGMAENPGLRNDEVLARAAREGPYAKDALHAIGFLRDPVFLPVIEKNLNETTNASVLRWSAEALFGYLSDEAAELLLLAAAKVQDTELRDRCLAQLEKIREYQDARERWAARKARAQTREQVIAELIALLGAQDLETRVQAIRGLATWEAVEAMPRLIQLASAKEARIAAAAREALERLNATEKE